MHYAEQFVISTLSRHPTAIKRISLIESHRAELEADGEWPDWCALPMAAVYSVLCEEYGQERLTIDTVEDLAPLTAAYIWRREKQIFSFDEDLFQTLIKQPFEGTLPSDILLRLPVPCVFVDMPFLISENDYSGFFAWIEYDNANKWRELRLLFISEDGTHVKSTPCPLLDTFDNSLLALCESAKRNKPDDLDIEDYGLDDIRNTVSHIINVLLYLCAEEPDYDRKPRKASAKPNYIADKPPPANCPTQSSGSASEQLSEGETPKSKNAMRVPTRRKVVLTPLLSRISAVPTGITSGQVHGTAPAESSS